MKKTHTRARNNENDNKLSQIIINFKFNIKNYKV